MIRKIGLLNHMGGGNLGDDATQVAVAENIRARWPDAQIVLFSMNPADTRSRHGIPSFPIRTETWHRHQEPINGTVSVKTKVKKTLRKYKPVFQFLRGVNAVAIRVPQAVYGEIKFLIRSFRIIQSFDLFIISGGGQLLDAWGGPWKFPYTVFKWTLLAKLSRTKCYFLNVGAGPLICPLAKWFIKSALALADYVSFRDDDSRDLVQKIGFTGQSQVSADCVYALDSMPSGDRDATERVYPIVGISPMAYCDPRVYWQKDQALYDRLIHNVASFGSWLTANHYHVTLFSTDIWFDSQATKEVNALLRGGNASWQSQSITLQQIVGLDQLLSTIQTTEYVITCRFHGVVFAHLLNKPVIALSHHPKVSSLMDDLGLSKYCLAINDCDAGILQETFLALVTNRDKIRASMAAKASVYKKTLLTQFDRLFPQSATV